jgi:hypothetical protein
MLKSQKNLHISTFFTTFAEQLRNKGKGKTLKYSLRHIQNENVNFI